jgi:DNA-binding transcriptional MerR regulator
MAHTFGIERLADFARRALDTANYDGQQSGRVREIPDSRTIRYYTTLGLLDRPVEMRGRKAFYGRRHVLQLVAIKRLQARGLSLVEVQRSLAGASDQTLSALASVPEELWQQASACVEAEPGEADGDAARETTPMVETCPSRPAFWASAPELSEAPAPSLPSRTWTPRPALHLAVGEGIELVIEGIGPEALSSENLAALAPVLKDLAERIRSLKESEG